MSNYNIASVLCKIRQLRERDYLSQEYMAAQLGISQNTYSKIELGKTKLNVEMVMSIAVILGADLEELINSETSKNA